MEHPPLVLFDLGVERRCQENYRFDNAQRASYGGYLLQYTLAGCGCYEHGGEKYDLPKDSGFFARVPEDSRYYLPKTAGDEGWEFFYLHFDGSAVPPFFDAVREQCGPVFSLLSGNHTCRIFFQLFEKCMRKEPLALYEAGEFLYRFLSGLLRELEAPLWQGSISVRRAIAYFGEHFSTIQGIEEAANVCGISHEHLTRMFRAETGQTPLQYLTKLRIEHGLFLLLNTQDSIDSIAVSCGFLNGNYFAKVFRRYLHCSPEEYRRRNRY